MGKALVPITTDTCRAAGAHTLKTPAFPLPVPGWLDALLMSLSIPFAPF
jgi:hypothetical protein